MSHDNKGIQAFMMACAALPTEIPAINKGNATYKNLYIKSTDRTKDIFRTLCEYYDISKEDGFQWLVENWREYALEQIHASNPNASEDLCYG